MNLRYSAEAERIRARFRDWVEENLPAEWRGLRKDADDETVFSIRRRWGQTLAAGGWVAPGWPVEYGGAGLTLQEHAIVLEELVLAGAPDALNSSSIAICGHMILHHGDDRQRRRYLPRMLDHSEVWCQGFSEPGAGSDLAALRTRGTVEADEIRITGQKVWTTMATIADHCYALVRTEPGSARHAGISLVLIPMDQPGIQVRPLRNLAGGIEFGEVFIDDAVASVADVVGPLNEGWRIAMNALSFERGISFVQRALRLDQEVDRAVGLAAAPGTDPALAQRLVDAAVDSRLLRSLVLRIVALASDGAPLGALPELAKLHWSETHQRVLEITAELAGPELGAPEHAGALADLLFARADTIYAGSSEVLRNRLAREIGLPSSRVAA